MDAVERAVAEGGVLFTLVAPATRTEPAHAKWYRLQVQETLFGGVDVVSEWGPLPPGPRPQRLVEPVGSWGAAVERLGQRVQGRLRGGYTPRPYAV